MQQHQHTASLPTKYGTPAEVVYCKRCVTSNQRAQSRREHEVDANDNTVNTLTIGDDGLCDACRIADEVLTIDWDARYAELEKLCDAHRSTDGSFDCIVPGSGGKDSVFQTEVLRDLGMHPLTVTAPPTIPTPWGEANFKAWTARYANVTYTPPREVHRTLTRLAFERLGHPFQPWVIMQQNIGPRAASDFGIPLVFYGEHFAMHGAGPIADTQTSLRNRAVYTYENLDNLRFGGASIEELDREHGITLGDLNLYMPVKDPGDTQIMYLGYYVPWSVRGNGIMATVHGFQPAPSRVSGGYQNDSSIDDFIDELHYAASARKGFGGRASFQACQDIRAGVITREQGIELVSAFDFELPWHLDTIAEYLRMTPDEVVSRLEGMKPDHIFDENGTIRHPIREQRVELDVHTGVLGA